jgi:carbamoyl-phosphate synthase large subunit
VLQHVKSRVKLSIFNLAGISHNQLIKRFDSKIINQKEFLMPKRSDIKKVLIIGSGPIIIGQACEFDYSGTQACKALRSLGYEIVLVNSNPATIMTDPGTADVTYIEPLNLKVLTDIIKAERPDALLPNLGGQSGLNLSSELAQTGVLDEYNVKVIGVTVDAIKRGEDRTAFKETMEQLGIEMPKSQTVNKVEDAEKVAAELGYPVVIRPAYTMGGTGGGLVYNIEELRTIAARGLSESLVNQVLVEESVLGWEELELEVVRDGKNQMVTVCFIENVDAMGVHTGDSFCTAPMMTIDSKLQKRLEKYSYDIVEAIEVIGGTNIQFAHDPKTDQVVVIEINPRTSRRQTRLLLSRLTRELPGRPPWRPRQPVFRSPLFLPCWPVVLLWMKFPIGVTAPLRNIHLPVIMW